MLHSLKPEHFVIPHELQARAVPLLWQSGTCSTCESSWRADRNIAAGAADIVDQDLFAGLVGGLLGNKACGVRQSTKHDLPAGR